MIAKLGMIWKEYGYPHQSQLLLSIVPALLMAIWFFSRIEAKFEMCKERMEKVHMNILGRHIIN